jgi:CheY-like chemotaxis protein
MKPDLDGSTVCRLLRGDPTLGRIPLGLITALDDDASRLEGLRAGADDFVAEPRRGGRNCGPVSGRSHR